MSLEGRKGDGVHVKWVSFMMTEEEGISCKRCGRCCFTNLIAYVTDEDRQRFSLLVTPFQFCYCCLPRHPIRRAGRLSGIIRSSS